MALNDLRCKLDYIFLRDGGNIDNLRIPGIYILNNTHTGTLPTGLSNLSNCILEVYGDIQILKSANTSLTGSFSRKYSSGSWSTWEDIINLDEISNHFIRKDVPQTLSQAEKNQFLTNSRLLDFFVRYDTSQSLTQAEKQQFRQNAGIPESLVNGYENPVDPIAYFNATGQNYFLQVGEVARIDFTNTTTVSLRIATLNGTYYEGHLIVTSADPYYETYYYSMIINSFYFTWSETVRVPNYSYLLPNNLSYTESFTNIRISATSSSSNSVSQVFGSSSFPLSGDISTCSFQIFNFTNFKSLKLLYNKNSNYSSQPHELGIMSSYWIPTTDWTLLGTLSSPANKSGTFLIRRLL
jgi:hypothetical protein